MEEPVDRSKQQQPLLRPPAYLEVVGPFVVVHLAGRRDLEVVVVAQMRMVVHTALWPLDKLLEVSSDQILQHFVPDVHTETVGVEPQQSVAVLWD